MLTTTSKFTGLTTTTTSMFTGLTTTSKFTGLTTTTTTSIPTTSLRKYSYLYFSVMYDGIIIITNN